MADASNYGEVCQRMTANLDRIVCAEALTTDLNLNSDLLGEFTGVGKIKIPKIDMDGLADYDRANGYVSGAVDLDWEERTLRYDRGRGFDVDIMDDEERMRIMTANLMAEFARIRVIPEVDATRFAEVAQNAGKTKEEEAALTDAEACLKAVLEAERDFEDAGNDPSTALLYCTANVKTLLRQAQPWRILEGNEPNTRITTFDGMRMKVIPSSRFYTKITLDAKGTTSSKGKRSTGYAKDESGKPINFILINPSVAQGITKHETLRYFSPEVYQKKNAHHWDYRLFHDLIVLDYAKNGIYVNAGSEGV